MPTNETRRDLLNQIRSSGYPGSVTEVFQAADQGIDLVAQFVQQQEQQQMQVAQTPQQQEVGLREEHAMGNTQASMAFPDVQPNQSFNTVGMEAPIDIQKVNDQGHLVESYKNVPPGIQDLPTGPYEGTVIESPAAYQKGGWKKFEKSKVGKFIDAKGLRRDKEHLMATIGDYFGYKQDEAKDLALDATAILNPAADFAHAATKYNEGKYTDAALYAGFGILPFSAGPLVRGTKKMLGQSLKIQDPNSLYRVVDVPAGTKADEIVKAAEYGTTVPPASTRNVGRRTGYENIQEQTDFDLLFTSSDQRWIAEGPQYYGQAKPQNLLNLYGGQNPYVVKMSRGIGEESLDVINRRTDILRSRGLSGQKTREIGTGVWEMKPYGSFGQIVDVGDIAKVPPGSIVNPNYLSRFDKNNITTIFGPKGTKVRKAQGILSAEEYIKRLKDNPDFIFQKGGIYHAKKQVGGLRNHMMDYLHTSGRDTSYVNTVMNAIGQHESKSNYKQKQISQKDDGTFYDGPGRGLFQFEAGPKEGGNTAINRTANFLKHNTDKNIKDFPYLFKLYTKDNSLDFSKLSKQDQEGLFIGDKIFGGPERRDEFDAVTRNRTTSPSQEEVFIYWLRNHKSKVNGKNISELTEKEIDIERKKWNSRTKSIFKKRKGGYRSKVF